MRYATLPDRLFCIVGRSIAPPFGFPPATECLRFVYLSCARGQWPRRAISMTVLGLVLVLGLALAGTRAAFGDDGTDSSLPPKSFTDNDPSLKDAHIWPPGVATSGNADPGPALNGEGRMVTSLSGRGPNCTQLSPCADVIANGNHSR